MFPYFYIPLSYELTLRVILKDHLLLPISTVKKQICMTICFIADSWKEISRCETADYQEKFPKMLRKKKKIVSHVIRYKYTWVIFEIHLVQKKQFLKIIFYRVRLYESSVLSFFRLFLFISFYMMFMKLNFLKVL